jgi:hypothetical protein
MTREKPELPPDAEQLFLALCAELEQARQDCDGQRGVEILRRIAAEVHPEAARIIAEGLAAGGFAVLSERMGAGDPEAYATVRELMATATRAEDDWARMKDLFDQIQAAVTAQNSARVLELLKKLSAEHGPEVANDLLAGLVQVAMTAVVNGVRAGDPASIAAAQRLLTI